MWSILLKKKWIAQRIAKFEPKNNYELFIDYICILFSNDCILVIFYWIDAGENTLQHGHFKQKNVFFNTSCIILGVVFL
jgi:hypothetical protein